MKILLAVSIVSIVTAILVGESKFQRPARCGGHTSPVYKVGGCDADGLCGALLQDGTYLIGVQQPVIGAPPSGAFCEEVK